MKSKKILTLALALVLIASLAVTVMIPAWSETKDTQIDAWDGTVAESFAGGTGIFVDPYLIENAEQFAKAILNTEEPGKYYKLTDDIYLNDISVDNWTENSPKVWYDSSAYGASGAKVFFEGNFDGAGHTIYGAYYNGANSTGIFPKVKNTTISNLRISDATFASTEGSVGAMVCWGDGVVNFNNCAVEESVSVSASNGASAFVGYAYPSVSINHCYSLATLAGDRVGAFFGEVWLSDGINTREIYNSYAVGYPLIWDGSGEDPVAVINCYSTVEDTEIITEGEITVVDEADMKGADALKNMDKLEGFYATDNYPAIKAIGELIGDVNGDWKCNANDVSALRKLLLGTSKVGLADINADNKTDSKDLVYVKNLRDKKTVTNDSYQLVWFDDFGGNTINDKNWTLFPRASYAENVFYTYDPANMKVASGNLNLTSIKNPYYNPQGDSLYAKSEFLVTGSVQTENKMSFKYGYLEIRAKVPFKEGCWPSFWLRSDNATGKRENAPYEVEIDIFEVFGSTNSLRSNLHQHYAIDTGRTDGLGNPIIEYTDKQTTGAAINQEEFYTFANADKLYDEYHTYGFEWTPDKMVIYIDGVKNCEWKLDAASLSAYGLDPDTSGLDTTMNVLFGNNLITKYTEDLEDPTCMEDYADTNLPAEFDVDYIRLYQKNDGLSRLYIGN